MRHKWLEAFFRSWFYCLGGIYLVSGSPLRALSSALTLTLPFLSKVALSCRWVLFSICFMPIIFQVSRVFPAFYTVAVLSSTSQYTSFKNFVSFFWIPLQRTEVDRRPYTDPFTVSPFPHWVPLENALGQGFSRVSEALPFTEDLRGPPFKTL